ncbi:hypothetical protein GCM10020367_62390 [Streptomyces sannanensis]|uniref:Uncharacterized protein n=1 Tax=Streptomyces sannanensis TaxID=285536 RepID=A0ABP6SL52_9ACTN
MDVHPEPFPLRQFAEHVGATFQPVARERELEFRVVTAPDILERITTDESRLRQVLRNRSAARCPAPRTGHYVRVAWAVCEWRSSWRPRASNRPS